MSGFIEYQSESFMIQKPFIKGNFLLIKTAGSNTRGNKYINNIEADGRNISTPALSANSNGDIPLLTNSTGSVSQNSDHVKKGYQEQFGKKPNSMYADRIVDRCVDSAPNWGGGLLFFENMLYCSS